MPFSMSHVTVLEHAVLAVDPARAAEFEAAFERAQTLISASAGFRGLSLSRCREDDGRYLLLVGWDSVAAHEEGFRGSEAYQEWKALLHHFYRPSPQVQHFQVVGTA